MAPLEPYEKVLVDEDFLLDDPHGELACTDCHGGNPQASTFQEAHLGMVKDPSWPDPTRVCGECHGEIAEKAKESLHFTLSSFKAVVGARLSDDLAIQDEVFNKVMGTHCYNCHSSCGGCHVSRPEAVEGGFVEGHFFQKTPPMATNCTSCHGSRVEKEYLGKNEGLPPDVHYAKRGMKCVACHKGPEMHGTGEGYNYRYQVDNLPRCENCHQKDLSKGKAHKIHKGKLSCHVCHAIAYKNCYKCHVGKDAQGLPYFKTEKSEVNFKIGLNPFKDPRHPYKFVTLRHVPVNPQIFDYYVKNAMANFDRLPTWKLATPHNIQKITPQNKDCSTCHSKKDLFLLQQDLLPDERAANRDVIVREEDLPKGK